MQKKRNMVLGMIVALGLSASGCSFSRQQNNLELGFEAINALEYENALASFETAAQSKEDPQQAARG